MDDDSAAAAIGDRLDGLGVVTTLDQGDLVAGAVVLLKVVDEDGGVRLHSCWSAGMSWIERLGMLTAAAAEDTPPFEGDD